MITSEVEYLGNLRTKCRHLSSGTEILTDAPIDNQGKGEAFSPTDLVATAYASCMITIMGIFCREHSIRFDFAKASVQKIMESNPRRIGKIIIHMDFIGNNWSDLEAEKVLRAGKACPVAKTLGDNVEVEFSIVYK
jgi:putative redox protein